MFLAGQGAAVEEGEQEEENEQEEELEEELEEEELWLTDACNK